MTPEAPGAAPVAEVAPAALPAPVAAPAPVANAVERVTVTADELTWVSGQLRATGHVRVVAGAESLDATSASGTAEELTVADGVWHRADGDVTFAAAEVRIGARSGVATKAHLERAGATVDAGRVSVDADGALAAEDARLEPCHCADGGRPALSFRARAIELLDARVAVIHGGTVRVFDVPVLPIPYWREPLDPKALRVLFPQVGYGTPGWSASEHVRFGVGPEMIELGPAWRQDRGARGELSLDGPVDLDGALGWDAATASVRGAAVTRGGFADARRRVGWDVTVQSDADYAVDYGPSWVDRGVAWHDSRLTAGWGPVRATGWLPDDGSVGDYGSVRVRPELGEGTWAVAPRLEARVGDGLAVLAGADGRFSRTWTALHVDLQADAAADLAAPTLALASGAAAAPMTPAAAAVARVELPFWAEVGPRPVQLFAGARAELAVGDAAWLSVPTALAGSTAAAASGTATTALTAAVGPDLRAATVLGDVVLSGDGALLVDDQGALLPTATVTASGETLSIRAEASPARQLAEVQTHGLVALDLGALAAADTALGWADVTLHPGRLLVGGGVSRGFAADDLLSGAARLGYDDGCSSLVLTAAFSPDRALPDFGAQLVLRK